MELGILSLILVAVLFGLLLSGLWVGFALMGVGLVAMELATPAPAGTVFATRVWGGLNSWDLTALPMFIWMGEILFRSRISS
ncbi:MAG: TRAP transporter large permease subunit, partial [Paracoccus sp. (in: a-proteobacteria)]|nr:TRAP transporter large permease subunit [Paracoccus sp. (in: a-proteobacteria)]